MEIQALNMAMDTIEALSGNITDQVGIRLKRRTSEILSEITGGKYREVLMDEELHMSVNTGDRTVSIERLSRGTLERALGYSDYCARDDMTVLVAGMWKK